MTPVIVTNRARNHMQRVRPAKHLIDHVHRKLIVPRGHWRVRGEDALVADRIDVQSRRPGVHPRHRPLMQQFHRQQGCMPFVHVKAFEIAIAERAQHANAADAENDFL